MLSLVLFYSFFHFFCHCHGICQSCWSGSGCSEPIRIRQSENTDLNPSFLLKNRLVPNPKLWYLDGISTFFYILSTISGPTTQNKTTFLRFPLFYCTYSMEDLMRFLLLCCYESSTARQKENPTSFLDLNWKKVQTVRWSKVIHK